MADSTITDDDRRHLRRCVELAHEALEAGDEPFGSILVDAAGRELFADRNRTAGGDHTRHPEFEIARWAAANLSPADRAAATVYTSGEHCPMCAAAHARVGLGRIVYAVSSAQLTAWHREWGVPPGPVAPLPVHAIAAGLDVSGPDPALRDTMRALHARRHGVDPAPAPVEHRYTHGHDASVLRSHSTRTIADSARYLEPHLRDDATLLDIGAGPGSITVELAARVAHVTATEINDDALSLSRDLARQRGIDTMSFAVEDVHALSFDDDTFDIVHAHQVLQHVADPVQALREMARVTKPGGIVAVRDADYAGFIWYPMLPELDEWLSLYRTAARANGGEPDAGRRLLAWAQAAGLTDAEASASVWNYADPASRSWWGGMWADRILTSALTRQLRERGLADDARLRAISAGWRRWAASPDGWFLIPHGELVWRKPEAVRNAP